MSGAAKLKNNKKERVSSEFEDWNTLAESSDIWGFISKNYNINEKHNILKVNSADGKKGILKILIKK